MRGEGDVHFDDLPEMPRPYPPVISLDDIKLFYDVM